MHAHKKLFLISCVALVPSSAFAASGADHLYKLAFSISQDGKPLASPVVVVHEGVPGSVEMSGPNGVKLDFTVTDAGDDKLRISTHVVSARGSSSPEMVVRQGHPASVSDGNIELQVTADRYGS
jgi:hypothetical protein